MSEDSSLYIIGTNYNSGRQAYEVSIGYMVKDEEVKGRNVSIMIVVNVPNHNNEKSKIIEIAIDKARKILDQASRAPVEV
jgi:hypothetical protein